jgi:modification methylase
MSPAKAKLIEPIEASFENVMKVLVGAPVVQEPEKPILTVDKSLAHLVGKVHHSDCIKFMNEKIPAESISCIVTSPPYNLKNSTGNGMKDGRGGKWPNAALQKGYEDHGDNMPHDEYVKWQRDCLTAMMRVLKKDGVIFYNHKWRVQNGLIQDRHDIVDGFPVRQIIIWKRAGGINFNQGYFLPTYEVIYMICKPDFKLAEGANKMTDVWEIPQVKGNEHPAPFPIELASKCIEASPGGVILDPFMGSGTTAIAAIGHNRDFIGIELSKKYCTLAESKISQYRGKAQIKT